MRIVVPSLGRADGAFSMSWLPQAEREILLAVHVDEADVYAKAYPSATIFALTDSCKKHTGLVRKEIMKRIREPFFFVDDDIRVYLKFAKSIKEVFDTLEHHMKSGASMAGIGQQYFSTSQMDKTIQVNDDPWVIRNKFVATVYGINPLHFDDCPLEFLPVYEDVALIIHAIQYGAGTITSYIATHSNVSPTIGGCNSWRNPDITVKSLETLVKLYPDVCSIRPTSNTTHSQYIGVGLRVAWAKIRSKIQ